VSLRRRGDERTACAIGGYYRAYADHIFGFVALTVVGALIIAALCWRFWKGKRDITVLILGALQAIIGLLIYLNRFKVFWSRTRSATAWRILRLSS
jgi:hypothetical protein